MGKIGSPTIERGKYLDDIEAEAQEMIEAYRAHYPTEEFDVVDVERTFEIAIPESEHTYTGKMDGVVRSRESGRLQLLEHKTEQRGGRNNSPEAWSARPQVSLYLYAGRELYNEEFDSIILDVLTRRSPAGLCPPTFRRDILQRTRDQQRQAIEDIRYIADQITLLTNERGEKPWPMVGEMCCKMGWKCEFYQLHVINAFERDPFTLKKFYQPTEKYLDLKTT